MAHAVANAALMSRSTRSTKYVRAATQCHKGDARGKPLRRTNSSSSRCSKRRRLTRRSATFERKGSCIDLDERSFMTTTQQLTSKVEISIACRNLKDKDVFSKSDPMAVLYIKFGPQLQFKEHSRSEKVSNNLNPNFSTKFSLDYYFETQQRLKFEIYDVDSPSARLDAHDFLGSFECSLGELVNRQKIEANLIGTNVRGSIILSCVEMGSCKESATIQMYGRHLDKKDLFGKSDPFFEIFRCDQPGVTVEASGQPSGRPSFTMIHRSEVIKNTLDPNWQPFNIHMLRLCCGDKNRLLRFDVHDWDSDGSHDFIGNFYTTVAQMEQKVMTVSTNTYEVINLKKKQTKKGYKNSGTVSFQRFSISVEHSFVDYISGGTQLNFAVAVDFTASNGAVTNPASLHYIDMHSRRPNQYESAIRAVGEIIQDYDFDRQFPGLGFGALIPPRRELSHCFPLSFRPDMPYCNGVQGLLQAYNQAIQSVQLYGPTNFAPVIRHISRMAAQSMDGSQYYVLLIITDGIISDMNDTIEAIVDASILPMSIIIVGVGNEDFSAMDILDSDQTRLRSRTKVAERDIVQFVAMRDFLNRGSDAQFFQAALAQDVLAELPQQLLDWMRRRAIAPLPRRQAPPPIVQSTAPPPYASAAPPGQAPPPGAPGGYPPPTAPGYPAPGYPAAGGPGYPTTQPGGAGAPPYPGGAGAPPYPGGGPGGYPQPAGAAPYPAGGQGSPAHGAAPYPGGGPGYPAGGPGYPSGGPGYPAGGPGSPGRGAPPYPSGGLGPGYPTGGAAPGYPSGPPGPGGAGPGYPSGGPGYPTAGPGYPSGPGASTPGYPSTGPGYPSGGSGPAGAGPGYPSGGPGPAGAGPGYPSGGPGPGYGQPNASAPPAYPGSGYR